MKNNFDALRLLAALAVMVGHMCTLTGRVEPRLGSLALDRLGVLVFFSISGFLIATSWAADPNTSRFLQRRFLRIWPGFAAVVLITFGVAFAAGTVGIADLGYLGKLVFQDSNLAAFPHNRLPELNGSLWTIPAEIECYLALCLFGVLTRSLDRWIYAAAFTAWVATYALFFVAFDDVPFTYFGGFFMAGSVVSKFPRLLRLDGITSALVLAAVCYRFSPYASAVLVIPLATIYVGLKSWPVLRRAGRFGDLSYGVYLWAFPIQQLVIMVLGERAPYALQLGVSVAGAVLMALASWHLIESPMLKLKPKRDERTPALSLTEAPR